MYLTEQQETTYIKEFTWLMHAIVKRFEQMREINRDYHDDLFQECAIVLLIHLRESESDEDIRMHFPFRQMRHAMCVFIMSTLTLSRPKRTSDFSKAFEHDRKIRAELTAENKCQYITAQVSDIDRADDEMAVNSFIGTLSETDRYIVDSRLDRVQGIRIAKDLGKSPAFITRQTRKA